MVPKGRQRVTSRRFGRLNQLFNLSKGSEKRARTGVQKTKGFWKTGIEEEAHLILENKTNVIFNIQSSLNRWRSNFRLEVNGVNGYGVVEGRGRSYGNQIYKTGQRWGWESSKSQAESEIYHIDNYEAEDSFYEEMISLFSLSSETLTNSVASNSDHFSAQKVMKLLEDCRKILKIEENV